MSEQAEYIEDFDDEEILSAAMDVFHNAIISIDDVPGMEKKIATLKEELFDINLRMRAIVARNTRTTRLLREALPEAVCEESAGMHELVEVLLAWAVGNKWRAEMHQEKPSDDCDSSPTAKEI